jgi:membrane dipeptidase
MLVLAVLWPIGTMGLSTIGYAQSPGPEGASATLPQVSERAKSLHADALVIDGHNDLPWELRSQAQGNFDKLDIAKRQPTLQTDLPRLREGGVGAQFWSVWVPVSYGYRGTALETTIEQIELVKAMVRRYPDDLGLALSVDDIRRLRKEGKIASLIGVEGGHCIENSLPNVKRLYDLGARYMTLTHADSLPWADSGTDDPQSGGLSPFGVQVIREMNDLGMMVDISHVSVATMHAALDASRCPVIFSHSSARAVADSPRNVPDDVLARLVETDGVVMVNFFSAFLVPEAADSYHQGLEFRRSLSTDLTDAEKEQQYDRYKRNHPLPRGTIDHLLDHIDHIAKQAGWQRVGLGSDYDGVTALPVGLEDVSSYPRITQGLVDRGYSDEQIRGILGENLLRIMSKAEQAKVHADK